MDEVREWYVPQYHGLQNFESTVPSGHRRKCSGMRTGIVMSIWRPPSEVRGVGHIEGVVGFRQEIQAYDGHLWRGHPPVEIFQEVKGNYSYLEKPFFEKIRATDRTISKWIENQLDRPLETLPPGARLEWISITNEDLARCFQRTTRSER